MAMKYGEWCGSSRVVDRHCHQTWPRQRFQHSPRTLLVSAQGSELFASLVQPGPTFRSINFLLHPSRAQADAGACRSPAQRPAAAKAPSTAGAARKGSAAALQPEPSRPCADQVPPSWAVNVTLLRNAVSMHHDESRHIWCAGGQQ